MKDHYVEVAPRGWFKWQWACTCGQEGDPTNWRQAWTDGDHHQFVNEWGGGRLTQVNGL
jgi:hypothetical protein